MQVANRNDVRKTLAKNNNKIVPENAIENKKKSSHQTELPKDCW
jgi:hypothetical protein